MNELSDSGVSENESESPYQDDVVVLGPDEQIVEDFDSEEICWKRAFEEELCCLSVHSKFPEVAHVAVGTCDNKCYICDFSNADDNPKLLNEFKETIASCAYSNSNANLLALACLDGNVFIYSADDYSQKYTLDGPDEGVEWLCWSSDGNLLLYGGMDCTCFVWSSSSNVTTTITTGANTQCGSLATYSETNMAMVGSDDGLLTISTLLPDAIVTNISKVSVARQQILSLDCHPKLQLVIVGTDVGGVYFVNISKSKVAAAFEDAHKDSVESVKFQPLGSTCSMAASCATDGKLVLWDCQELTKLSTFAFDCGLVKVLWHPTRPAVFAANNDGNIIMAQCGKPTKEAQAHEQAILDVAMLECGDDQVALVSASQDGTLAIVQFQDDQ